jgi:outer membrane immunogenic protein
MRHFVLALLATAGVALAVGSAAAADQKLVMKAPPRAPIFSWTGGYLGISGGWTWGRAKVIHGGQDTTGFAPNTDITDWFDVSGGLIGGTAGYNSQINQIVLGAEADVSWVWKKGTGNDIAPFNTSFAQEVNENILATARGRLGFLPTNDVLLYITGGVAVANVKQRVFDHAPACGGAFACTDISQTQPMFGAVAGAGIEGHFSGNWSAKVEALYIAFGDVSYFTPAPVSPLATFSSDQRVRMNEGVIRAGLNYHL